MPFLDDLPGIRDVTVNGGAVLPRRSVLNIIGTGVSAVDNPVTGKLDLTLPTSNGGTTSTAPALSGDVNDYSPPNIATSAVQRWSSSSTPRSVTGLDAAGNQRQIIINFGSATITLAHSSSSSAAANRFLCPASTDYALSAGSAVEVVRDSVSDRWRVVS